MKTIILKVQIKVKPDMEPQIEEMLDNIETPTEIDGVPIDALTRDGYEIMILDRNDK